MRLGKALATGVVDEQAENKAREPARRPGVADPRQRPEALAGRDSSPPAREDIPTTADR